MEKKLAGKSYSEMVLLLNANVSVIQPTPFTSFTMLSFFWEETFFNNISQVESGTGVGFGQAEPAEFYRFDANGKHSALARQKGYLVEGLPPVREKKLMGTLTDQQSVRVACAFVRDLFEKGVTTKRGIMNAYGGVGFKGPQPAHLAKEGGREAILKRISDCETALWQAQSIDAVMSALQLARPFDDVAGFRAKLFPGQ